jgi:hypothetical protein
MDPEKKINLEEEKKEEKEEEDRPRRRCTPMNPCSLKSRRKTNGSALGMDELHSQTWSEQEDTKTSNPFKLRKWTTKEMLQEGKEICRHKKCKVSAPKCRKGIQDLI